MEHIDPKLRKAEEAWRTLNDPAANARLSQAEKGELFAAVVGARYHPDPFEEFRAKYGPEGLPPPPRNQTAAQPAVTPTRPSAEAEYRDPFNGRPTSIVLDPYGPNPAVDYVRASMPGAVFVGAAPTMFTTGELPAVTGSGVEPGVLRLVHWRLRHSAAITASRAGVLKMIEHGGGHTTFRSCPGHGCLGVGPTSTLRPTSRQGWRRMSSRPARAIS